MRLIVTIVSITDNQKMNKAYLQKFAKHLKKLREAKKLTQDDLGVNGISRSMVGMIETAQTDITITKLKIIADNLNLKVKDLFDFE